MTKQEIQALINAKIAGQGSATDQGGALADVLREVVSALPVPVILETENVVEEGGITLLGEIGAEEYERVVAALNSGTPVICKAKIDVGLGNFYESISNCIQAGKVSDSAEDIYVFFTNPNHEYSIGQFRHNIE